MKHLIHLPLEAYKERYTEVLSDWETEAFEQRGFEIEQINPAADPQVKMNIQTGEVLDSVNRPLYAFKQMTELMRKIEGSPRAQKIYFSDFFTPGLEALPYSRRPYQAYAFLWAQTFDMYDFTNPMVDWMRPWEYMAFSIYNKVFVATELLKELITIAIPQAEQKIEVVGLPFNSKKVGQMWDKTFARGQDYACVYSSRWDREKNPELFLEVVTLCPDLEFAICTASPTLRGTAVTPAVMHAIDQLDNLTIYYGLSKEEYYAVLNASRVQMNTAFQDWVSFTLLEALTYDCLPLYPNFRAFPEVFNYDTNWLYKPTDAQDAAKKLYALLESDLKPPHYILNHHDETLNRIADWVYD